MTTREPLQIVEFDIGRCSLRYGVGACTAALGSTGVRKCFNTYATCQDKANYAATTNTLRFAKNQNGFKRADRIYPALQSVSTNPVRINLSGVNDRMGSLGERARVTISLKDFRDSDIWFDHYQSERVDGTAQTDEGGYNPGQRGTFFGKLRFRFPYYIGQPLRVLDGYVGEDIASMRARNFVVTEWKGPDAAGNITITASDVLDLTNDKKAQAPFVSRGRLASDVADSGLVSFNLVPSSVGDEYASSGTAVMGSEIVRFTRSGDTITLTARAQGGSTAQSHSEDDTFQQCYVANSESIADVAADLMINHAGIDASFINLTDWNAEAERWLSNYRMTTIVTTPTGVTTLLAELSQFGVVWWWDEEAQQIRMRANRPLDIGETAPDLTDRKTFIEDSLQVADLYDQRITQVQFFHGVLDYTRSVTNGENYKRVSVSIDSEAESTLEYGQPRAYTVFSRWLGNDGNYAIANPVAGRTLARYSDTPQEFTFEFDIKDQSDVVVASPVTIQSFLLQDETGLTAPTQMQVTSVEETMSGHRLRATAQSYQFKGRFGFFTENSRPDYASSTDAQRETGTYYVDETTLTFSDGTGPYRYF